MKRYQRAVALLASALVAGTGLTLATTSSASAADLGSLTFSPATGDLNSAPTVTTSGPCPAATVAIAVRLTGGNVPPGEINAVGNNTSEIRKPTISLGFDFTLNDIANLNDPRFDFRPAPGQPPLTYTATLGCYDNQAVFGAPLDTYDGQFTIASDGTYTALAPVVAPVSTTIKPLTATPAGTATTADTVTFTADVDAADSSAPVGSVQFTRGGAAIGSPVAVDASGVATFSGSLPVGTGPVVANFDGTAPYTDVSSAPLAYTVTAVPARGTSIALAAGPTSGAPFQQVTLTGTVTPATGGGVPAGSCTFTNGSALIASSPVSPAGVCTTQTTGLSGAGSLTAAFVPADQTLFTGSTSAAVTYGYDAPQFTPDPQTVVVTVPVGNLTIFTPYTPQSPLNLGTMTLNAAGTGFDAAARFDKVTVTDTRAGNPGWTASLAGADFVGGASGTDTIPVGKSSFTGVTPSYIAGNAVQAGDVTTTDLGALTTSPQAFARTTAGNGTGTVDLFADFTLSGVSTSTTPGLYTATVVFTIA